MKKDEDIINEEDFGDYETNKKVSDAVHKKIKDLGYDYVLKKLQENGFSNPEKLAEEIISKQG